MTRLPLIFAVLLSSLPAAAQREAPTEQELLEAFTVLRRAKAKEILRIAPDYAHPGQAEAVITSGSAVIKRTYERGQDGRPRLVQTQIAALRGDKAMMQTRRGDAVDISLFWRDTASDPSRRTWYGERVVGKKSEGGYRELTLWGYFRQIDGNTDVYDATTRGRVLLGAVLPERVFAQLTSTPKWLSRAKEIAKEHGLMTRHLNCVRDARAPGPRPR